MPTTFDSFIYALCEPGSRIIRYLGKARRNPNWRFNRHLKHSDKLSTHLGKWISSVFASGHKPELLILSRVPFEQASEEEKKYIHYARVLGFQLTNATEGGDGASPGNQNKLGKKESPETREKKHKRMLGNQYLLGHTHSEETKQRIGDWNRGKRFSPETRKRMSEAAKERWTKCRE